jgi:hypothetical protein
MIRTFPQWEDEGENVEDAVLILDDTAATSLKRFLTGIARSTSVGIHQHFARRWLQNIEQAESYNRADSPGEEPHVVPE